MLAERGWQVTGADISATALAATRARAEGSRSPEIEWVEADLTRWEPERQWDLVLTSYAHADIGQVELYRRLARWVAPGGTLLIFGHLPGGDPHGSDEHHVPDEATATLDGIAGLIAGPGWRIDAGYQNIREVSHGGRARKLRDVVIRASRLPG